MNPNPLLEYTDTTESIGQYPPPQKKKKLRLDVFSKGA